MLGGESRYPSCSQLDFQLTEKAICSPVSRRRAPVVSRLSLEYTLSQISIENELEDHVPDLQFECLPCSSLKDRECGYATASTRHTLASALQPPFQTIRTRAHSCRNHPSLQKIRATLAVCPIRFQQLTPNDPPRKASHSREKFRLRKSISVRDRKNAENLGCLGNKLVAQSREGGVVREEVLAQAFKVKTISLQQNDARGKVYMKKLIQNRASILHLSDTCELYPETAKRTHFRF